MTDIVLPDVVGRIKAAISSEIKTSQPVSNWASRIGHPCKRYLVHTRLDWDKLEKISPEKKMMFDLGHVFERNVAKVYLEKAGFEIVEMDRPVQSEPSGMLKRVKLHGKLDFICRDTKTGMEFPVEVKSAHPNTWEKVDCIEDMLLSKSYWVKQYPGQLMIYLLGGQSGSEYGLFLFINKITAEPKAIWLHQDYTYAEELIKKAESVNQFVDRGEYPDRIEYDENICGRCDFASLCLKDVIRKEANILTDDELIQDLEEREELKDAAKRYAELDKDVKEKIKREWPDMEKGVAGDFLLLGKTTNREGYTVEPTSFKQISIKKIGQKEANHG